MNVEKLKKYFISTLGQQRVNLLTVSNCYYMMIIFCDLT